MITHGMGALYKMKLFLNRLKVIENSTALLAKATFTDLQAFMIRINGLNKDLHVLQKAIQKFLEVTNQRFRNMAMTMTLNNHRFAINMFTKQFTAYNRF